MPDASPQDKHLIQKQYSRKMLLSTHFVQAFSFIFMQKLVVISCIALCRRGAKPEMLSVDLKDHAPPLSSILQR